MDNMEAPIPQPTEVKRQSPPPERREPPQKTAEQSLNEMNPIERTSHYLGAGQELIRRNLSEKERNIEERQALGEEISEEERESLKTAKERADQALAYKGGPSNKETSDGIRAIVSQVDEMGTDLAGDEIEALTKNLVIIDEGGKSYTYSEWKAKLAPITDEAERAKLEDSTTYGFNFSEYRSTKPMVDRLIDDKIKEVRGKIGIAKFQSEKGNLPELELQLAMLEFAKGVRGEFADGIRYELLNSLRNSGVDGLDGAVEGLEPRAQESINKMMEYFAQNGMKAERIQSLREAIAKEGLAKVLLRGDLPDFEGLDEKIFGENLSPEEKAEKEKLVQNLAEKYLPPDLLKRFKKHKGQLLFLLIIAGATLWEGWRKTAPKMAA